MKGYFRLFLALALVLPGVPSQGADGPITQIKSLRVHASTQRLRAVFDLSRSSAYHIFQLANPNRLVVDFPHSRFVDGFGTPNGAGILKDVRTGQHDHATMRVVFDLRGPVQPKSFMLKPSGRGTYRLVIDLYPHSQTRPVVAAELRYLPQGGRKVVVAVDPGHGGIDPGARGPNGLLEKNVTLAIGKRLAKLIDAQPGMRAVLTRTGNYYVSLPKRYAIARKDHADLFISIHANSCPHDCGARGASVWVLSTHGKENEAGRWLARSENASDLIGGVSLGNKPHALAAVLLDLSQGASMQASREVGTDVLHALGRIGPLYNRRVDHANFVVLRAPDVPSILIETAFINNPHEARLLASRRYRNRLARAILVGVKGYFETTPPPGTWFALQAAKRREHTAALDNSPERTIAGGSSRGFSSLGSPLTANN